MGDALKKTSEADRVNSLEANIIVLTREAKRSEKDGEVLVLKLKTMLENEPKFVRDMLDRKQFDALTDIAKNAKHPTASQEATKAISQILETESGSKFKGEFIENLKQEAMGRDGKTAANALRVLKSPELTVTSEEKIYAALLIHQNSPHPKIRQEAREFAKNAYNTLNEEDKSKFRRNAESKLAEDLGKTRKESAEIEGFPEPVFKIDKNLGITAEVGGVPLHQLNFDANFRMMKGGSAEDIKLAGELTLDIVKEHPDLLYAAKNNLDELIRTTQQGDARQELNKLKDELDKLKL
jgi:hypothetical protein